MWFWAKVRHQESGTVKGRGDTSRFNRATGGPSALFPLQ